MRVTNGGCSREREGPLAPLAWSFSLHPRTHSGGSHDVRGAVDAPVASSPGLLLLLRHKQSHTELRPTANVVAMSSKRNGSGTEPAAEKKKKKRRRKKAGGFGPRLSGRRRYLYPDLDLPVSACGRDSLFGQAGREPCFFFLLPLVGRQERDSKRSQQIPWLATQQQQPT